YILITHGHGDHYGGARWLVETYGPRVVASDADYDLMRLPFYDPAGYPAGFGSPPRRDLVAADGQELTLGDTTITMILTPGHTPGTLSFIIPVKDKGAPHLLAIWGGTGIPADQAARIKYFASIDHFKSYTDLGVDAELSNHPFVDDSLARMEQLRAHPNGPNA